MKETWLADPPDDGSWHYVQWAGCEASTVAEIPERFKHARNCLYRADWNGSDLRWTSPLFMPGWASRLTLEVTRVRVERLQDIREEDAKAEGCQASEAVVMNDGSPCYSHTFQKLWRSIHGIDNPKAWDSNPWVWVLEFRRVQP